MTGANNAGNNSAMINRQQTLVVPKRNTSMQKPNDANRGMSPMNQNIANIGMQKTNSYQPN